MKWRNEKTGSKGMEMVLNGIYGISWRINLPSSKPDYLLSQAKDRKKVTENLEGIYGRLLTVLIHSSMVSEFT